VPDERKDEVEIEQIIDEEPPDYVILSDVVEGILQYVGI